MLPYNPYSLNPTCIILFFVLLALGISILVVNSKLYLFSDTIENRNMNELMDTFENYLKTQKALIWINSLIIICVFIYLLFVSFNFFKSEYNAIRERRRGFLIRNIILGCMLIIAIALTIYMNQILNEMNISNSKEESKKIFIIIPILSVISIFLASEHLSVTSKALTRMRNIYYMPLLNQPRQEERIGNLSRTASIHKETTSQSNSGKNLENRYSNPLDFDYD